MKSNKTAMYTVRITDEMKNWVKDRACFNRRSLNVEFNIMLEIARKEMEKKNELGRPI